MANTKKVNITPHEGEEQARLFSWAEMQSYFHPELRLLFHIPNGGLRSKTEAARFQKEGVKSGVPDLLLPVPNGHWAGLFIELKRREGGRVSPEQKAWIEALRSQGYAAEVAHGWEEAAELITGYLANSPTKP